MATRIFGIGASGLNAAQSGVLVAGHNISNAANDGLHRQEAVRGTPTPQETGTGFFGEGVTVDTVRRAYRQFLDNALLQAQTQGAYLETYGTQIRMIDNLLADPAAGLSPALQSFFSGVQDLASNPASIPSRQQMLSLGDALVARFQGFSARLTEMRYGVNRQISDTVNEISTLAGNIARVNQRIMQLQTGDNRQANDLLDERTALLTDLNKLVRASVVEQSDGSINVLIGNGQSLVLGAQTGVLAAGPSAADPQDYGVFYLQGGARVELQASSLRGGTLGGLLAFRSETLDVAQNQLGRVATVLAQTFNDQHRLGRDLNGALGQDFFTVPAAAVVGNQNNAGTAVIAAANSNVVALTGSDYRVQLVGGTWTLTRLTDGTQSTFATFPQTIDGVTLTLVSGAAGNDDSFLIQPTCNGARDIAVALSDTAKIAAAAPVRSAADLANTGKATISAGVVTDTLEAGIAYNPAATTDVFPTPGALDYGYRITLTGDRFTVGYSGVADNRNALLLAGLQTLSTVGNGTANYQSAYSQLVAQVGNRAREIEVQGKAQDTIVTQTQAAQQSLSDVNLDEEAANLIRYQQAYQASGKVLQLASTLFDAILEPGK